MDTTPCPIRALTHGPEHHFFGYYGISSWDRAQRFHLALETDFHEHRPRADDAATVGVVDTSSGAFEPYGQTSAFNLQQGSMMHWIDAGFGEEFTFNDWMDGQLASRAVNVDTRQERVLDGAIAAVSPTQPIAVGLNFVRMSRCRAVVGYAVGETLEYSEPAPEDDGLHLIDLCTGECWLLLSIAEVIRSSPMPEARAGLAWFNHVLFNTDGTRLLFFCRVKKQQGGHYSSLWTVKPDGSDLVCHIDYHHVISHFAWFDPECILISTDVLGRGMQFLKLNVVTGAREPFGEGLLPRDGHASFSPDFRWIVCDTYPQGEERLSELMLHNASENRKVTLGRFHAPKLFSGDVRCDLHPRWSPDGSLVSFDSVHEGSRQIYLADVSGIVDA